MTDPPTGTVTFLLTDVESSTRLWEASPAEMRAALARHDRLVQEHVERHDGVLVKARGEGDSCFAVFAKASDALAAALATQLVLHAEPWSTPSPPRVRMALHTGEAELRDHDYHGSAVNRCARLRAIAHGGQVLVSHATYDLVRDALPENTSLRDLGEQRLRDLARPEQVLQLCHPDLPSDFPPLRSLDSYPTNLPLQLTSFVGREREIAEVKRLLGTTRLITLTGTGGCGKTRLAYQVAAELLDDYPDGVWVVELAPLADPELVPQSVASALGVGEQPGQPILATLQSYLRPRRLLLVLDNCEHLLDACGSLTNSLLRACPMVKLLTTGREALGMAGETTYRVPSLALPDPRALPSLERLAQCESVRLFVERAQAVQPTFSATTQNAPALARICWRLDGIPLALELAAARVRALSIEGIASRLDDRFRLLTGGSRTALRRQQTLRATIDWSYDLLSPAERVLFRRVAVFAGGWTLQAAEEVCSGQSTSANIEQADLLDLLLRLVDRSLVMAEVDAEDERYHLPETVREYALEELLRSGEAVVLRDRHRDWCLRLLTPDWREWSAEKARRYFRRLELEHDNLRGALAWSLEANPDLGLRLAAGFSTSVGVNHLWMHRGYPSEGRYWLRQLLDRAPGHTNARTVALRRCAWLASDQGDLLESEELAEECLAVAREIGDAKSAVNALILMGEASRLRGDFARARARLEQARSLGLSSGERAEAAWASFWLGLAMASQGDYHEARAAWEEAISEYRATGTEYRSIFTSALLGFLEAIEGNTRHGREMLDASVSALREYGDMPALGWSLSLLGYAVLLDGSRDRAVQLLRESLALLERQGHRLRLSRCLSFLGIAEGGSGAHDRAAQLIGAAMKIIGEFRPEYFASERVDREVYLAAARSALGEEAFARAWAEGQAMTLEQAVEYALGDEAEA